MKAMDEFGSVVTLGCLILGVCVISEVLAPLATGRGDSFTNARAGYGQAQSLAQENPHGNAVGVAASGFGVPSARELAGARPGAAVEAAETGSDGQFAGRQQGRATRTSGSPAEIAPRLEPLEAAVAVEPAPQVRRVVAGDLGARN